MERIQDLRLFVRVVDLGSFSKAAAEVGIGQPAATKLINRMEKQLGARLLHRTTHGVSPTEIGLLYYDKCKLISHHAGEAESVSALLQQQAQGAIRISTSVACCDSHGQALGFNAGIGLFGIEPLGAGGLARLPA